MSLEENLLVLVGIVAAFIVLYAQAHWRKSRFLSLLRQEDFEKWRDATFGIKEEKP